MCVYCKYMVIISEIGMKLITDITDPGRVFTVNELKSHVIPQEQNTQDIKT